jgi:uracil-DNA glycosylase family 4
VGFFFHTAKATPKAATKAPARRGPIPIASLQALGCTVCPLDKRAQDLTTPKMQPSGPRAARIYVLGSAPSEADDRNREPFSDSAGQFVRAAFGAGLCAEDVRFGYITQCNGDQTQTEIACCRNRVVSDIEATAPDVIVGVGDAPLLWATQLAAKSGNAMIHRGTVFVVRVGRHSCYFYSLLYPNFLAKRRSYGKSEYEVALTHDIRDIKSRYKAGGFSTAPTPPNPTSGALTLITGTQPRDFQTLVTELKFYARQPRVAIDIETTGLRPHKLKAPLILTVSVATPDRALAFPLHHPEGWGTAARNKAVEAVLLDFLLGSGTKVAHNLAMEMEWFAYFFGTGLLRRTEWEDTMAMAHTLDERAGTKSLDTQTVIHFGFSLKALSNLDTKRLLEYPLLAVLKYNALDSLWTARLDARLSPILAAEDVLAFEYSRKVRLASTLVLTEFAGIPVDLTYARQLATRMQAQARSIEAKIKRCPEVGRFESLFGAFSPTNPDHVLKLMRDVCERGEVRVEDQRTGAIRFTSDEEALQRIPAHEVPSAAYVLEHRALSKVLGTYIVPVLEGRQLGQDGMIRCKYSSMVAETGRLASDDPNIQNWPARKNKEVRGIVVAETGGWILACDYGQIEFRVIGMATGDDNLLRACWTGYDVHGFWAQRMVDIHPSIKDQIVREFKVDWEEKGLKTLRQEAKNKFVFPQFFGASVKACAEQLGLPDSVAQQLCEELWDEFPNVKRWQERLVKNYEKTLYVETLGGRKRRGPLSKNQIINHPIQGTAADIVTEAMAAISEQAEVLDKPWLQPRLNVHDDLSFWVPDQHLESAMPWIAAEMSAPRFAFVNVPLVVEMKIGQRWSELQEIQVWRGHEIHEIHNPYN